MALASKGDTKTLAETKQLEFLLASLMEGYSASVDIPANLLTPELLALYPNAIVIATTRDRVSWLKSMRLLNGMTQWHYLPFVTLLHPYRRGYQRFQTAMKKMYMWRFGKEGLDSTEDLEVHEAHLRKIVPPERLFWYNISDGWEPLCEILGVPVPNKPFPHNNSADEAKRVFRMFSMVGSTASILFLVVTGLAAGLVWRSLAGCT